MESQGGVKKKSRLLVDSRTDSFRLAMQEAFDNADTNNDGVRYCFLPLTSYILPTTTCVVTKKYENLNIHPTTPHSPRATVVCFCQGAIKTPFHILVDFSSRLGRLLQRV